MDINWLIHECPDPHTLKRLFYFERYAWLALAHDMAAVISTDGMFEDVNTHWEMVTSLSRESMQNSYLTEYIHFDDRERALADLQDLITSDIASTTITFRFNCGNEEYRKLSWNVVYSPDHESYFCVVRDVSQATSPELLAYRDALTGLRNRLSLDETLPETLGRAQDTGSAAAVMFIDLDGFKRVNDTLGHKAGDSLLMRTAKRMTDVVGDRGHVYRLAGDEFIILLTNIRGREDAAEISSQLLEKLNQKNVIEGNTIKTSASLGVAMFPEDSTMPVALLDKADKAMYHVKRNGKNGVAFFADLDTPAL